MFGRLETVKVTELLIKNKAEIDISTSYDVTPLRMAVERGKCAHS